MKSTAATIFVLVCIGTAMIVPSRAKSPAPGRAIRTCRRLSAAEISAPVVFVQAWSLDTSGRLAAAPIVARLFPHSARARALVARIERERLIPAKDFTAGPYPADRLHYLSGRVLEFSTPAGHRGAGTEKLFDRGHLLRPSSQAVRGIAALSFHEDELIIFRVRVPPKLAPVATQTLTPERNCLLTGSDCMNAR